MAEKIRVGMLDLDHIGVFEQFLPGDFVPNKNSTVVLGATENKYAAGVLWAEFSQDDCEIMHIAVHPAFRRHGIGREMLSRFLSVFRRTERLIPVYMHFVQDESNRGLEDFLTATGQFSFFEEGNMIRMTWEQRRRCEGYRKMKNLKIQDGNITQFFSLPYKVQEEFVRRNIEESIFFPYDILGGHDSYEESLCLCHVIDNKVATAIFVKSDGEMLHVSYLHGENNMKLMQQLLTKTIKEMDRFYPKMPIQAEPGVNSTRKIFEFLTDGEVETYPVLMAMWNFAV